jgi:2-methylcitrate dehydratase PrpD
MAGCDLIIKDARKGPSLPDGEKGAIRQLAEYAVATQIGDLPSGVVGHARVILLDTIGVIFGGSIEPQATAMAERLGRESGGPSTLIGHRLQASPLNAALVNGTAATWLDFDSGHRPPPGKPLLPAAHCPVHLVPAALAVGEAVGAPGTEILAALIVGYDAGARIAMGSRIRPEIHPHGTCHNVSAAVAARRLSGGSIEWMQTTIGLATHLEIMPSFQNAYEGCTVRNTYAGVGAAAGVLASQLAGIGITPEQDALGAVYGGIISPWLDPERITEDLGKRFEITLGFIKPYPMCRFGHPALEAAEAMIKEHHIVPEEIEEVEVHTFSWAATLDDPAPTTDLGAKFSVPWAVASMLVRKSAGAEDFRNKSLTDPLVRSVAAKVRVKEDPLYTSMTPAKRPARVIVKTGQGQVYTAQVEGSGGGPEAPLSMEKIQEKFRSLAEPVIGKDQADAVIEKVERLEGVKDIRDLTRLLMPSASRSSHSAGSKPRRGV